MTRLPKQIKNEAHLEELLSTPREELGAYFSKIEGDLLILGAGGKMGPTLAKMARNAFHLSNPDRKVIAVSRFSNSETHADLLHHGVETIQCDLLNRTSLERLPSAQNIIYMAGKKFGSHGNEADTWAMNAYLPGMVAERFDQSRIAAFSTGNVYPFVPVESGGCTEEAPLNPLGEYAQSCMARERVFEYFSQINQSEIVLLRLNYAVEMRYGVLLDIAMRVYQETPIDLSMGHVNVIWQGDANAYALLALQECQSPPSVLNLTGRKTLSVRVLAEQFGDRFHKQPCFEGEESCTALLSNASKCIRQYGEPTVSIEQMVDWLADWVRREMPTWNKPTKYSSRTGKF
ncbi:MAG: NAD-dependent epimerase/dehydratase family protein [Candidatus Hinthialibacter antarcticus]|nr:NAD-dependent epimerase/dehydratase family protein [Candidatus Hinthialibacter antarcticus]